MKLQPLNSDVLPAVREALERSTEPLSLPQLCKQLTGRFKVPPKKRPELRALIDADPSIYEWPRSRFWHRDPRDVASAAAIEIASAAPLPEKELLKSLALRSGGFKGAPAKELIRQLVSEGRLYEDPPWGKKRLLSAVRLDPERYRAELDGQLLPILEKYAALGITPRDLVDRICAGRAASPARISSRIMEALERLEPRRGLVVAVGKLRRTPEVQGVSKSDFDRAAIQLLREHRIFLHDHTAPYTLAPSEREELIDDEKGKFYVAIAWREPEHDAGLDS